MQNTSSAYLADLFEALSFKFTRVGRAASAFKSQRIEYYEYLADVMADAGGRRNLINILRGDAERYGEEPRGVLSAYWADRFQDNGANLAEAWAGTIPDEDLMIIRVAQNTGGTALEQSLRDVARVSKAIDAAKAEFVSTLAVGVVGVLLAFSMLLAIPFAILPQLTKTFGFVPQDKWGSLARGLLSAGETISAAWAPMLLGIIGLVVWLGWALPNLTGPVRSWLDDKVILFKLYRDFRGALFMATLSSMVKRRQGVAGLKLREALVELAQAAEHWLRWHIERVIDNIDQTGGQNLTVGSDQESANVFDTGLLDREIMYYMLDMMDAKGFDQGLELAGLRTEKRAVKTVGERAKVLRWLMLGTALGVVLMVSGWTFGVIFEMKSVMIQALS